MFLMERSTLAKWLGGLAIAVILGFFAGRLHQLRETDREILRQIEELKASRAQQEGAPTLDFNMKIEGAATKGHANAILTLIEFSDFECPYCGRYMRDTYPQIDRDYVGTGKIRYVFRHFPLVGLHPRAMKAGEAGECARRQEKFWPFHDLLFANQKSLEPASLVDHARAAGLAPEAFATCLEGQAASTVLADVHEGTRDGVSATPTFFFGFAQKDGSVHVTEKLVGARPYEAFQSVLDRMLTLAAAGKD